MTRRSPLVKGLFERYKKALADEGGLEAEYDRISRALADTRETKKLCAALLRKEGFDPEQVDAESGDPVLARMPTRKSDSEVTFARNGDGPTALNATHAVYLVMRKRENAGFTVEELERFGKEDHFALTLRDIHKVIWTQIKKGRMERLEDGRLRLTVEGEKFNKFRKKEANEPIRESIG